MLFAARFWFLASHRLLVKLPPRQKQLNGGSAQGTGGCEKSMIDVPYETAFAATVEHYTPLVRARCERELGGADADDAAQAVFLVLWRRWRDVPTDGPALSSWVYRTTGNVLRHAHRDRSRRRRAEKQ